MGNNKKSDQDNAPATPVDEPVVELSAEEQIADLKKQLGAKTEEFNAFKEAQKELASQVADEEADRIEKAVLERVAAQLLQEKADARILDAGDYLPLRQITRVPIVEGAENDPNGWESVAAEDFNQEHAQALIDHFTRLESTLKMKNFSAVKALHEQLGKRG